MYFYIKFFIIALFCLEWLSGPLNRTSLRGIRFGLNSQGKSEYIKSYYLGLFLTAITFGSLFTLCQMQGKCY